MGFFQVGCCCCVGHGFLAWKRAGPFAPVRGASGRQGQPPRGAIARSGPARIDGMRSCISATSSLASADQRVVAQVIIDQARPNSHPVMPIDARLTIGQSPACPNPSREAKRRRDRKHQKGLCVVLHAVLQHTLRPQDRRRALDTACTNATDENSNGCLSRSFADIKELLRLLFRRAPFAT